MAVKSFLERRDILFMMFYDDGDDSGLEEMRFSWASGGKAYGIDVEYEDPQTVYVCRGGHCWMGEWDAEAVSRFLFGAQGNTMSSN